MIINIIIFSLTNTKSRKAKLIYSVPVSIFLETTRPTPADKSFALLWLMCAAAGNLLRNEKHKNSLEKG